jgi:hypothetical protein
MIRKMGSSLGLTDFVNLAALTGVMLFAVEANAGWEKVDPLRCQQAGAQYGADECPTDDECASATVKPMGNVWHPELEFNGLHPFQSGLFFMTYYCPVPDGHRMPTPTITGYHISGRSGYGSASGARGCVQSRDGMGEVCATGFNMFPETDFTDWLMPVPSNWSQWENTAYTEIRLRKVDNTWPAVRLMHATN